MTDATSAGARSPETWLFDFDGTLVDSVALILASFRHATRTVLGHVPADEVLMAGVGQPLREQMDELDPARADELVRVYRAHNMRSHGALLRPYSGVDAMLAGLRRRGHTLGIVTSKMRDAVELGMRTSAGAVRRGCHVRGHGSAQARPCTRPPWPGAARSGARRRRSTWATRPYDLRAGRGAGVAHRRGDVGHRVSRGRLRAERPDRELARPEVARAGERGGARRRAPAG